MIAMRFRWITDAYKTADADKNGLLSLKEVVALLESLNIGLSHSSIEQLFRVRSS